VRRRITLIKVLAVLSIAKKYQIIFTSHLGFVNTLIVNRLTIKKYLILLGTDANTEK